MGLASMYYAGKKTQTSITISFAALEGAACMNNTFCLAIFMGLVYFKGIAWQYTAETLSIVFVQLAVAVFARKGTLTPVDGAFIIAIYPLSVVIEVPGAMRDRCISSDAFLASPFLPKGRG